MQLEALAIRSEKSLDFRAVSLPGEGAYPHISLFHKSSGQSCSVQVIFPCNPGNLVIASNS